MPPLDGRKYLGTKSGAELSNTDQPLRLMEERSEDSQSVSSFPAVERYATASIGIDASTRRLFKRPDASLVKTVEYSGLSVKRLVKSDQSPETAKGIILGGQRP
jgi:hypothetical protein